MNWVFLDIAAVERLHEEQILRFGGSPGIRDRGLLESAVMRAELKVHFEPDSSVPAVAASLGWGLVKNHAFIDGNKRIGLAAAVTFLKLNGYRLTASTQEQVDKVLQVATGAVSEHELAAWIEQNILALIPSQRRSRS